jgi:glycosyltransferase involved in cell wall biosynthesis
MPQNIGEDDIPPFLSRNPCRRRKDILQLISVVIATKDRSTAIAEISLPSLLKQTSVGFEILVWDASCDEATKHVVERQKPVFERREIALSYAHAPRVGLVSQRNDAVRETGGEIVFFLDDDAEVSTNGMSVIKNYFDSFPWMLGLGLPLIDKTKRDFKLTGTAISTKIKKLFYPLFFGSNTAIRKISASTRNILPTVDLPGIAEWLSGGSVAYRKSVFGELKFDERLQRFGGYSFGEDVDFSHRVMLHFGEPLLVASGAHVVHHNAEGGRIKDDVERVSSVYYNTKVIRDNFNKYRKYGVLPFLWEQRIGRTIAMLVGGYRVRDMISGYIAYRRSLRDYKGSADSIFDK